MKLHVLFDRSGRILAAAKLDSNAPVQARPVPDEDQGHRAADVEVPSEFRDQQLSAICTSMIVDSSAKLPSLTPRAAPGA